MLLCLFLSAWQFNRLSEKRLDNQNIISKTSLERKEVEIVLAEGSDLEYLPVKAKLEIVEDDLIRIVNRSNSGVAGEHVAALARMESGNYILLNRGFVPLNSDPFTSIEGQEVIVEGWLRNSVEKELFGVIDNLDESQAPRFDIDAISKRLTSDIDLADYWLQIETIDGIESNVLPDPIDLPELDEGSHFSYAIQWIIFALLTMVFYYLILRRKAKQANN